jgi:hypothetical protein
MKILTSLVIGLLFSLQVSAQCGVYFKDTNRQALSDPIAYGYFEDFDGDGKEDLLGYTPTLYVASGGADELSGSFL